MPTLIGVAWPYANGGLHLGHVAGSLLPPDIFRRYQRMAGQDVLMVSGSDCHGTPIMLKADAEGVTPADIVDRYNKDHTEALRRLGIGFDLFTRTTTDNHVRIVQEVFTACMEMGYIDKRTSQAPYDTVAGRFLPDRYVEGTCPHCNKDGARGDQCDHCGKTLDAQELVNPRSKLNPDSVVEFRDTDHYFFLLSKLQPKLERYVAENSAHWRSNTINFTKNWLSEGLKDRAITRDLTWGIPIPESAGSDNDSKRIYVWFEAVCGYFSAAVEWAQRASGQGFSDLPNGAANLATGVAGAPKPADAEGYAHYWQDPEARGYYFLGKDNIPFHTIIWPGILIAYNEWRTKHDMPQLNLPFDVPANEFLNLSGEQFSKSRGVTIGVHDVLDRFQADAVRYYLSVNMPEQRDSDWTWDDFLSKTNDELVGTIGNLVHRVLSFTEKNIGHVPTQISTDLDRDIVAEIQACGRDMANHLGKVELKKGVRRLLEFAGWGNQTMQETAPWKLLKEDRPAGEAALHSLLRIVKALAVFMAPYTPEAADQIWKNLGESGSVHDASWDDAHAPLKEGAMLPMPQALFRKLDPKDIPGAEAKAAATPAEKPKKGKEPKAAKPAKQEPADGVVAFDDFAKIQLRIATIKTVEAHPDADKLYVLKLDVGDLGERQVVAGLKAYYTPEELAGQTVAFVANLAPVKLRGVESQGMILAADHGGIVSVLNPNREVPAGAKIR